MGPYTCSTKLLIHLTWANLEDQSLHKLHGELIEGYLLALDSLALIDRLLEMWGDIIDINHTNRSTQLLATNML